MKHRVLFYIFLLGIISFHGNTLYAEKLTIIYTNSLNGYIDYCLCKAEPKGGLVKRSTEIKNIRKNYPNVLLFDTGDNTTVVPDLLLSEYIYKAFFFLKYDAMLPGDQEFSNGMDLLLQYSDQLNMLADNITLKSSQKKFTRYKLIKKGLLKIGIIGTVNKESFRYSDPSLKEKIIITDHLTEISSDIAEMKKEGANFFILLSHSGDDIDYEIQKKFPEINVIIGGHSQTLIDKPQLNNNSIVVQAGTNGAHIGILELTINNNRITDFKNSFRNPDHLKPEDDPRIRALIDEYKTNLQKKYNNLKFK